MSRKICIKVLTVISLVCLTNAVPPLQYENPKKLLRPESSTFSEHINKELDPRYRLPTNLVPLSYTVSITPILDDVPEMGERFTAPGNVNIRVRCDEETSVITLHSFLLTIDLSSITVTDVNSGTEIPVRISAYDEEMHFYNISLEAPLEQAATYDISIDYIAPVSRDRANGLYLTNYIDPATDTVKYQAMTQLEPARGRQVFPSFDEPGFKAIFTVRIGRLANYISLTNAPLRNSEPMEGHDGWFWDNFETTAVPMPTYLFAMAVCDFTFQETDIYRVPVRSYGPKHWIDEMAGVYSAETTAKILTHFEDIYNATYDMPKMDSIVVPGKGGAMENWGLITYGNWLMYFNGVTTESERWSLDSVLAHELAHQWFGNLVTCQTWSQIWLNEGITTYISYIGVDDVSSEFEPRKYILNDAHQPALLYDASENSHPMIHNGNTTAEISMFFSAIVYDKGASVVRMMEGFLTEATLHAGLKNYLQRKAHGNAVQDELFEELTKQAHADQTLPANTTVKEIMDTWTLKKGFPLLRVSRSANNSVIISQETFANNEQRGKQDPGELWEVPISFATKSNPDFSDHTPKLWLEKNTALKILEHNTNEWVVLNTDSTGFYRVLYDNYLTTLIQLQLQEDYTVISALSRSQLIDDYFNLVFQRYISVDAALSMLNHLAEEPEMVVWVSVTTNLRKTFRLFSGTTGMAGFRNFMSLRLEGALDKIGFEHQATDKGALVMLRTRLLDWACALENAKSLEYASRLFNQWQSSPETNPIPVDIQQIMYCAGVAVGGETAFDFALNQYKGESSTVQKSRLLNALTCTDDPSLLSRLLELTLDPNSGLVKTDASVLIRLTTGNSIARPIVLNFLRSRTLDIVTFFESASPIADTVNYLSLYFGSDTELADLQAYIEENREILQGIQGSLSNSIATIEDNISWMNTFFVPIKTWLEANA